jgi:hypothetical protein
MLRNIEAELLLVKVLTLQEVEIALEILTLISSDTETFAVMTVKRISTRRSISAVVVAADTVVDSDLSMVTLIEDVVDSMLIAVVEAIPKERIMSEVVIEHAVLVVGKIFPSNVTVVVEVESAMLVTAEILLSKEMLVV